jgi:hypothetical protein
MISRPTVIYVASKAKHRQMWCRLRGELGPVRHFTINSSWIDVDDAVSELSSEEYVDLWMRCAEEVNAADVLVLYSEPGEELKGALIETGSAALAGKPVLVTGHRLNHSWLHLPNVTYREDVRSALASAAALS